MKRSWILFSGLSCIGLALLASPSAFTTEQGGFTVTVGNYDTAAFEPDHESVNCPGDPGSFMLTRNASINAIAAKITHDQFSQLP